LTTNALNDNAFVVFTFASRARKDVRTSRRAKPVDAREITATNASISRARSNLSDRSRDW